MSRGDDMGICVHGKPLSRPELCDTCWHLAYALGLVATRYPPNLQKELPTDKVSLAGEAPPRSEN